MGDEAGVQIKPVAIPDLFWRSLGPRGRWEVISLDHTFGLVLPHGSRYYGGDASGSDWNLLAKGEPVDLRCMTDAKWVFDKHQSTKSPIVKLSKSIEGRDLTLHLCLSDWSFRAMCEARELIVSMESESKKPMPKNNRCWLTSKLVWAGLNKHRTARGMKGYIDDGRLEYPYCFPAVQSASEQRTTENIKKALERRAAEKAEEERARHWNVTYLGGLDEVMRKALAATAKYDYIDEAVAKANGPSHIGSYKI